MPTLLLKIRIYCRFLANNKKINESCLPISCHNKKYRNIFIKQAPFFGNHFEAIFLG